MNKVYQQLYDQSTESIRRGHYDIDNKIDLPDERRGITLLIQPDQQTKKRINDFLQAIAAVEPQQYFYPDTDLHITVMSIISCYAGFDPQSIDQETYCHLVKESLKTIPPFEINMHGITASPSGIIICGYYDLGTLDLIREEIRKNFRNSGLEQSIDKRYKIATAHCTVIRFRQELNDSTRLCDLLDQWRYHDFGWFEVNELELVSNDWYQRAENVKSIAKFKLK